MPINRCLCPLGVAIPALATAFPGAAQTKGAPEPLEPFFRNRNRTETVFSSQKVQSPPKGAGKIVPRENCRKVSKTFLTFLTIFCPARKWSKSVEKLFDTF